MPTLFLPSADVFEPKGPGLHPSGLRKVNERAVLALVALNPGISSAEIARRSGLSPQTVSAMLVDLEHQGLVLRGPVTRGKRGQPATPLHLNKKGAFSIGCELGWRHMEVLLIDLGRGVLGRLRRDYPYPDARTGADDVADMVNSLKRTLPARELSRLVGLGVAMPGTIPKNIDALGAPAEQTELWAGVDVAGRLQELTGLPVTIFNDGTAGCWAELAALPKPRPADFAYLQVSTFVGAGIVASGTLWTGSTGNAADLGSMLVPGPSGEMQAVHSIASVHALEQRLKQSGAKLPEGDPGQWDWAGLEPMVGQWLDDSAKVIALTVINARAIVDFQTAVVDGIMPPAIVARLVEKVRDYLELGRINSFGPPAIVQGTHGRLAPALGAAMLPIYRKLFSRAIEDILDEPVQRPIRSADLQQDKSLT